MTSVFAFPPETVEFFPEDYFAPLDMGPLFPCPGVPLEIDLGCGDGGFLTAMAKRTPEHNFLGVERLLGRVRRCTRLAARFGLTNVRMLRIESHYFLRYLLPPGAASVIHILFPDPWPKRRHQSRRLFQTEFLDTARIALTERGEIRFTTDDLPYYTHALEVAGTHAGFEQVPWEPGEDYPQTDFEREFRGKGLPIYRLLLRKVRSSTNP